MATKPLPSPEVLRQLLSYDPETGKLFWKERPISMFRSGKQTAEHNAKIFNSQFSGKEALTASEAKGYKHGKIEQRKFKAHRVIWAIYYNEWPPCHVDHINGIPDDNRIRNLRLATNSQNLMNRGKNKNNTSGFKGVTWDRRNKKWIAQIKVNRRRIHLGYFERPDAAHQAYCVASERYHGAFSKTE